HHSTILPWRAWIPTPPSYRAKSACPGGTRSRGFSTLARDKPSRPSVLHAHRLRLGEEAQRLVAAFAADAALFHAAEGSAEVAQEPAVHPDRAAFEAVGDAVGARQVARPEGRRQAIGDAVGMGDHVVFALERRQRHDGPEDLFLI